MPRTTHRPRKSVSARRARWLGLAGFRYSPARDAYVLRLVGRRVGPVYQVALLEPGAEGPDPADAEEISVA